VNQNFTFICRRSATSAPSFWHSPVYIFSSWHSPRKSVTSSPVAFSSRFFPAAYPTLWNKLSVNTGSASILDIFKSRLMVVTQSRNLYKKLVQVGLYKKLNLLCSNGVVDKKYWESYLFRPRTPVFIWCVVSRTCMHLHENLMQDTCASFLHNFLDCVSPALKLNCSLQPTAPRTCRRHRGSTSNSQ